jgi:hypothetical protein
MMNEVALSNVGNMTLPRRTIIDEAGNTFHVEFRGSLTTVTVTLPNGIRARGNARLHEDDVYNKDFGQALATVRASQRALKKYERWLSREGFRTAYI